MSDLPDYYTMTSMPFANAYSIRGGADASKPADPDPEDVYMATDTDKLYYCVIDDAWRAYFMSSRLLTANSLLYATADYTPIALTVAASRIVGRKAAGDIAAMTGAETMAILSGQAATNFDMNTKKITGLAAPTLANDATRKTYVDGAIDTDINTHALLTTGIHGVGAGAIVGTTLAQVLTNKTLTTPVINGAVTTTGLTLPAFTAAGNIDMDRHAILGIYYMYGVANASWNLRAKRQDADGAMLISTPGVSPGFADTTRVTFYGRAAEAAVLWANCVHSDFKLNNALDANSQLLSSVLDPVGAQDAATKAYADTKTLVTTGTYTGDDTVNRSIPHGLGATPKIVFIIWRGTAKTYTWRIDTGDAVIHCLSGTGAAMDKAGGYAVTAMDGTNFYVGNAADTRYSANKDDGSVYDWVAIS